MASVVDLPGISARVVAFIALAWQSVWFAEWWRYLGSRDGSIGSFAYLAEGLALSLCVTIYVWSAPLSQRVANAAWGAVGALAGLALAGGFSVGGTAIPAMVAFFFAMLAADMRVERRTEQGIGCALVGAVVQVTLMLSLAATM